MKKVFEVEVAATSASEAFGAQADVLKRFGKRTFSVVSDTFEQVRQQIAGKRRRVVENPGLYADKIAEYGRVLADMERRRKEGMSPARVVAYTMLDHGDSRVDNPGHCCVVKLDVGRWLIFGFDFSK